MSNPHFLSFSSWNDVQKQVPFKLFLPVDTLGETLQSLQLHIRDHKLRDLEPSQQSLEAHYGAFVYSQAQRSIEEARRLALSVAYGADARDISIAGHNGKIYERGPEVPPNDIDGRSPAVVAWHDGGLFLLIASDRKEVDDLLRVAKSLYASTEAGNQ